MKKIFGVAVVIVLILIAGSVFACSSATPTAATQGTPSALPAVKASNKIVAEGKVVPVQSAALSFQSGGLVAQVPVAVGEKVDAGKVLAQLDTKQLELQLKQAEANLASAQAKLDQLKRGPTAEDKAAAEQALKSAQASYDKLLKPDANELAQLKADVDKANAMVRQAQAAYDQVGGDSNSYAGALPQRAQLQSAWIDYQRAAAAYDSRVHPTDAQVQQALAAIQTAKSNLAKLTPTAEDLAAAQANADALRAARDLAQDQLSRAKLTAPFTGSIVAVDIKAGEQVAAGTPAVRLADISNWQIETTDLTEISVVNVKEGDVASIKLDALPDTELTGKVATIKGYGENRQGDIVYTLVIKLDKPEPRLRWNMTAKVTIAK